MESFSQSVNSLIWLCACFFGQTILSVQKAHVYFLGCAKAWGVVGESNTQDLPDVLGTGRIAAELGPPVVRFYPFLVGRVPLLKFDYRKKGTVILTSPLEDLVKMRQVINDRVANRGCRSSGSMNGRHTRTLQALRCHYSVDMLPGKQGIVTTLG